MEGETDETSLGNIFKEIFRDKEIRFFAINGDITSDSSTNIQNIKEKITEKIDEFIDKFHINHSDIIKVIHLIDTDGVFVSPDYVKEDINVENITYFDQEIITKNKRYIVERNKNKSKILKLLFPLKSIYKKKGKSLKYRLYYFSRNLEHVLHNKENCTRKEKNDLSDDFSEKYLGNEKEFIDFISENTFTVNENYNDSWKFIEKDNNSLKRFCNLHLVFKEI